jgi:DNA-binding NtrC family response regulator
MSHVLLLGDARVSDEWAHLLREAGHQVIVAADLREAARALDVPGLDVLVVPLSLPGLEPALLRQALAPGETAPPDPLEAAERRHIARALRYANGNKRRTAQLLGIARSTLLAKVRKYGLDADSVAAAP